MSGIQPSFIHSYICFPGVNEPRVSKQSGWEACWKTAENRVIIQPVCQDHYRRAISKSPKHVENGEPFFLKVISVGVTSVYP
jgi:hypothetical protein